MPEEGIELRERSEFMTAEELIDIAKTFIDLGVKKIRLTGGEPLVKKNARMVIEALGKLPIELTITTNAILVDKFISTFKQAGIKSVNVSLDSLKENRFNSITKRNYFDKVMSNIDLLISSGFKVKVNAVVMRNINDDEIIDFIKLTENKPIHVRFIEFMPFDGNQWNWDKMVSYKEMNSIIRSEYKKEEIIKIKDAPNDTSKNFRLVDGKGTFGMISSITNPFCDTCNRIRLTADGKIKNCLFSENETDLLTSFRNNEDISPLIVKSIQNKKEHHAGINSFQNIDPENLKNRSMITIGG